MVFRKQPGDTLMVICTNCNRLSFDPKHCLDCGTAILPSARMKLLKKNNEILEVTGLIEDTVPEATCQLLTDRISPHREEVGPSHSTEVNSENSAEYGHSRNCACHLYLVTDEKYERKKRAKEAVMNKPGVHTSLKDAKIDINSLHQSHVDLSYLQDNIDDELSDLSDNDMWGKYTEKIKNANEIRDRLRQKEKKSETEMKSDKHSTNDEEVNTLFSDNIDISRNHSSSSEYCDATINYEKIQCDSDIVKKNTKVDKSPNALPSCSSMDMEEQKSLLVSNNNKNIGETDASKLRVNYKKRVNKLTSQERSTTSSKEQKLSESLTASSKNTVSTMSCKHKPCPQFSDAEVQTRTENSLRHSEVTTYQKGDMPLKVNTLDSDNMDTSRNSSLLFGHCDAAVGCKTVRFKFDVMEGSSEVDKSPNLKYPDALPSCSSMDVEEEKSLFVSDNNKNIDNEAGASKVHGNYKKGIKKNTSQVRSTTSSKEHKLSTSLTACSIKEEKMKLPTSSSKHKFMGKKNPVLALSFNHKFSVSEEQTSNENSEMQSDVTTFQKGDTLWKCNSKVGMHSKMEPNGKDTKMDWEPLLEFRFIQELYCISINSNAIVTSRNGAKISVCLQSEGIYLKLPKRKTSLKTHDIVLSESDVELIKFYCDEFDNFLFSVVTTSAQGMILKARLKMLKTTSLYYNPDVANTNQLNITFLLQNMAHAKYDVMAFLCVKFSDKKIIKVDKSTAATLMESSYG